MEQKIVTLKENLDYNDKTWIARHICHNKSCIKAKHLISGTSSDNQLDSRQYKSGTKLNKEKVRKIKKDLINISKYKYKKDFDEKWAEKYSVSKGCIAKIRLNENWKDIII